MIDVFFNKLKINQLTELIKRYNLMPKNKRRIRKRASMVSAIKNHWKTNGMEECPICFDVILYEKVIATPCSHLFCYDCLLKHLNRIECCPICREPCLYIQTIFKLSIHQLIHVREMFALEEEQEEFDNDDVPFDNEPQRLSPIIINIFTTCIIAFNFFIFYFVYYNLFLFIHR